MSIKHHILLYTSLATLVVALTACSSAKNTARSRWWQSFNTRYNVYYNGAQAYIEGSLAKETGNKDNYTEIIPLYTVTNKSSRELGKGNYDNAITKAQKAIQLHSIKRRPEWNKQRRKTERDIEWLNRREYNPFMWKVWMLMGRSQFHEGDFDGAASTFGYMSRLYDTQPAIRSRAQAWLAKALIEGDFRYDAEDVIRNMRRDSIPWQARKEWDYALADYHIHTGEYEQAIPYLRKVIRHEMRRKQKAREWFLMGQLCQALGRNTEAYKAYAKAIGMNPPYELEFNARVAQTEVMADKQADKMLTRLRRMARSDKNAEYLDQVYYAMGNIYLSRRDTVKAIAAYEKGNSKGTRSGVEKGVLLLKLGGLYWDMEKYSDARRCYNDALGMIDKERKDYEQLSKRSKVLDELVPYTDAVHLQDSLQQLAKMDEKQRNAAIDRVIEALKKKEKEEEKAKAEQNAAQQQRQGNKSTASQSRKVTTSSSQAGKSTLWYFYNTVAVTQGKQQFQSLWGKRDNVDNWQRNNKTVVSGIGGDDQQELTDEQRDSIFNAQQTEDSLQNVKDSVQNDPHRREYYLAQIPFTAEQVEASNVIIQDGLHHSGVIFKDKLDNLALCEKSLVRLTSQFPQYEHMDDVYYHLFLLYSRMQQPVRASLYVDSLKQCYPKSQWTTLLTDPYYAANARNGIHLEDSLYAATYDAFKADRFGEIDTNTRLSAERFPLGANRDKFIFIGALSKLNSGSADECLKDMNTLLEKYPTSKLAEMAGMIINGVKAGKKLRGAKFDIGDVWSRRTETLSDSAEMKQRTLSNERNAQFVFMLVYQPDSVNENKLLYQLARFNFTSFLVRDFDIAIEDEGDIHRMRISGFRNYDEALQYARQLLNQESVVTIMGKQTRPVIISEENLPLLGTVFSYDDYAQFYNKHFAPLKVSTFRLLTEPAEVVTEPEHEAPKNDNDEDITPTDIDNYLNDTFIGDDGPAAGSSTTIIEEEQTEPTQPSVTPEPTVVPTPAVSIPTVSTPTVPTKPTLPTTQTTPITTTLPTTQESPITVGSTDIIFDDDIDDANEAQTTSPAKASQKRAATKEQQKKEQTTKTEPKKETQKVEPQKTEPKKQETFDLDDEYYDLDGF